MSGRRVRPGIIVSMGIAVALASVAVVSVAPWAAGATQFKHVALSPLFELGIDQGLVVTVTNVGTTTVKCAITIRAIDGSVLDKQTHSVDPGTSSVEEFSIAPGGRAFNRLVVSSATSSRPNPCLPMGEIVSFPSGQTHLDAILSDFLVTNTSI